MRPDGSSTGPSPTDLGPTVAALAGPLRRGLVAVDFDGTLAPIVRDPSTSRPADGAVAALRRLGERGTRIAVVTGREAEVVTELGGFGDLPGLVVEGVYGAQTLRDGRLERVEPPPAMRQARAEVDGVLADAGADPAVWVEDKDVSFVVHARLADEPDAAMARIEGPVTDLARRHGLDVHPGKQVLEIRVPGLDKGVALRRLLEEFDPAALLWAGDDLGDVPAFAETARWREATGRPAVGVAVRPADSPDPLGGSEHEMEREVEQAADVVVDGPAAVVELLTRLADAD